MSTLSIIIPCYNESDNIPYLLKNLLLIKSDKIEIILVNNGSTDDTLGRIILELEKHPELFKVINIRKNLGYGNGIMAGVRKATSEIICWTHADLQSDPKDALSAFNKFEGKLKTGNYIVKGKRINRNIIDHFFTMSMTVITSFFLKEKFEDINGQPKMFHRNFISQLNNAPDDFSLDLFFLYKAKVNNMITLEYPVNFEDRLYGKPKGGGSFWGKIKLIKRTLSYILNIK